MTHPRAAADLVGCRLATGEETPEWTPFAAMVGGSAAGLTGLTFIVVAFRFDVIAVSQEYRNRAAQVLTLISTVIVTAALIAVPQPTSALRVEYIAAAALVAILLRRLDRAARDGQQG